MGGGASLMVPLKFSVVTEKTVSTMSFSPLLFILVFGYKWFHLHYVPMLSQVFATPEASIGFHTDCGFSYMLSHLPGHLGKLNSYVYKKIN